MVLEMNEMTKPKNIYVAIDLKSFYASVECVERGLDQFNNTFSRG